MNPAAQATPTAPGRADQWIRRTATITVAGLAGITDALSYNHMRQLAGAHVLPGAENPHLGGVHDADEEPGISGGVVGKVPSTWARCRTQGRFRR